MRTLHYRRESRWPFSGRRRIVAAVATLVAFGGIITVTQVSNASTTRQTKKALAVCANVQAPKATKLSTKTKKGTYTTNKGTVTQHADDGAGDVPSAATLRTRCRQAVQNGGAAAAGASAGASAPAAGATTAPAQNGGGAAAVPEPGAGLGVLTNNCGTSKLLAHDGFQKGDRCVSTAFGEVGSAVNNPSLLITDSPKQVAVNTPFTVLVSTRNLIRDRFLAAGQGGYYVESSVLAGGLVRGHFHTACRMLVSTKEAPAPDPVPAFFVATEDSKGSAAPDVVAIQVPGLPAAGTAQCASWAGDGSHRIPMMERANQTPAFDAVRIDVTAAGANTGGNAAGQTGGNAAGNQAGGNAGGNQNAGGQNNGGNNNGPATAARPAAGGQPPPAKRPTTRTTIVKPAPATARTTRPAVTTRSDTSTANGSSSGDDNEQPATVEAIRATPRITESTAKPVGSGKAAKADYTYSNDKGAPDADPSATTVADAHATAAKAGNKLALTGTNMLAVIGGGVVLILIGLVAIGASRRRRSRSSDWV
ncbi:MAG: hypothetical protein QOH97_4728 [Actinoplanes sp.]|jgi:hypothetical protein|nr:hypothetical protein [Actinoplanes sp.]